MIMKLIFTYCHSRQVCCLINILLLIAAIKPVTAQTIVLSEVVSSNKTFADPSGDTPDWVELHNPGDQPICLDDYYLNDRRDINSAWSLTDICMEPGSYHVIFLSGKEGTNQAPFSLKQFRENIYLFHQGTIIDSAVTCIPEGLSYGTVAGTQLKYHFRNPTPGTANDETSKVMINPSADTLTLSARSGFYTGDIDPGMKTYYGAVIHYTLNGDFPTTDDPEYAGSFTRNNIPADDISLERTAENWRKPDGDIFNGFAIRAVGYSEGCPVTNEIAATFLISENGRERYSFPVASVIAERSDFFSKEDGIYVKGDDNEPNYIKRGKDWERDIHLELLSDNYPAFSLEAEASIHGRYTRYKPQKSLRIELKKEEQLTYPLFGEENSWYRSFTIQTVDKHTSSTFFKDELISELALPLNIGAMRSLPAVLFINGEYWGVHNIRERQDEDFISLHYNVSPSDVRLIEEPSTSDNSEFSIFVNSLNNLDLTSTAGYSFVKEHVDIDNLINYCITNIYFANFDWPHNNVRVWKSDEYDGRWRFLFYDCDVCMSSTDQDILGKIYTDVYSSEPLSNLFSKLLLNHEFRSLFYGRMLKLMTTTYSASVVLPLIDSYAAKYEPLLFEHISRWGTPGSYYVWQNNVEQMKSFAVKRSEIILDQLFRYLGNPVQIFPNPAAESVKISFMKDAVFTVKLYDSKGTLLRTSSQSDREILSVTSLSSGMYFIEVIYGEMRFSGRFIKTD